MQKTTKMLQKGFTIIELIVVIAVLGVLVLLALPKFLDYTEKAKVAQVKSEIVAKEKFIDSKRVQNDDYIKDWEKVDVATMESLKKSLFNKKGLITDSNNVEFEGEYYNVPKNSELQKMSLKMKTSSVTARSLKGDFYLGEGGEVYYYDENLAHKISGDGNSNNNGGNGGSPDGDGDGQPPVIEPEPELPGSFKVTFKDYYGQTIEEKTVEKGQSVDPPSVNIKGYEFSGWDKELTNITSDVTTKAQFSKGPTEKDLGYSDSDFTWGKDSSGYIGKNGEKGYFQYTGTGRSTVEIPHVIQGVPITSYYSMFKNSPAEVTKVISTNKNVTSMNFMLVDSRATTLDVSELDTSNVTNMNQMFRRSQAKSITFGPNFNTSNATNMKWMFWDSQATTLDLSNFDTSNVTDMSKMFYGSQAKSITFGPNFNTSNVTDMNEMFRLSQATTLDLSNFDTSNVTDMSSMFYVSQAKKIDISNFNTSNVTNMSGMFWDSQTQSITFGPNFNTSSVESMSFMFATSKIASLDLSKFDTSNVENMGYMFYNSETINIKFGPNFNTSKVKNMTYMFSGSKASTLDLSTFDTSNVTNMRSMFWNSLATKGYARIQADADKFISLYDNPAGLTFQVGKP